MNSQGRLQGEIRQTRPFRSPAEEAALCLVRTSDEIGRRITAAIAPSGITLQQYNVLRILRGSNPQRLPTLEIAARMIEQTPGITRLLDRLEAKGLIARERCEEDRRRVYCTITRPGLTLLGKLDGPSLAAVNACFATVPVTKLRQLITLLDAVRGGLDDSSDNTEGEER